MTQKINLDDQFKKALDSFETSNKHIFLTGNAGTGKSTLLEYWRDKTKKNIAVLAPTGVAALNIKGQTIHSFFGFRPDITVQKIQRFYRNKGKKGLFKKLDAIIIDEISMVRADLLDCIDAFLKMHGKNHNLSFGGIKMIFIGDLHQLPPVVRGYGSVNFAFESDSWKRSEFESITLKIVYRTSDDDFIALLDAVRFAQIQEHDEQFLNS